MELLTAKQNGAPGPRNSGTNYLILDEDDRARPSRELPAPAQTDKGRADEGEFVMPLLETASSFRPNDFQSKLLPPENKPLETAMLKRAKELFTSNDPKVIAKHMLSMDCKVRARVGGVWCWPVDVWAGPSVGPPSALPCRCCAPRTGLKINPSAGIYLMGGNHRPEQPGQEACKMHLGQSDGRALRPQPRGRRELLHSPSPPLVLMKSSPLASTLSKLLRSSSKESA